MFANKPYIPTLSTVLPREAAEAIWNASYISTGRECGVGIAKLDSVIDLVKRRFPEYFTVQAKAP